MQIKPGDTLSAIAAKFRTTVSELIHRNPEIKDKNLIYSGAQLNVPGQSDSYGGARRASPTNLSGSSNVAPGEIPPGQVGDWIKQAMDVMSKAGVPMDKMNPQDIAMIIQHESGGNPLAQNNWDSNAAAGHPSIGLMQTIQPTFDSYALPGHNDIRNPVDNIIAGVRYAISRYGSTSNVPGVAAVNGGGSYVGY